MRKLLRKLSFVVFVVIVLESMHYWLETILHPVFDIEFVIRTVVLLLTAIPVLLALKVVLPKIPKNVFAVLIALIITVQLSFIGMGRVYFPFHNVGMYSHVAPFPPRDKIETNGFFNEQGAQYSLFKEYFALSGDGLDDFEIKFLLRAYPKLNGANKEKCDEFIQSKHYNLTYHHYEFDIRTGEVVSIFE